MNFKIIIPITLFILVGCNKPKGIAIRISNEVINEDYIGNGIQWDPYDEAEQWGSSISDSDWDKLYKRLDFMRPNFVRCLINSPYRYYNAKNGKYYKDRNSKSIIKLLSYCQKNNITVLFGEFNPPKWELKQDPAWIDMAVDYLNFLVNEQGFTCIKYYNLFNEPDGNWSSTNGDYEMWKKMVLMFNTKKAEYPTLSQKVRFGAPDVVMGYKNSESKYQPYEWIGQSAKDMDSIIGIYDIHAYPGQYEVRSGQFAQALKKYVEQVPKGKKLVLGEAGYKYYKIEDSSLMAMQQERIINHPFTKGSDCNMLVYEYFYGLDMPLLCMEVMNEKLSGMAVWMLDDAMHSNGDAGDIHNIKLWGMWNTLGEEVFGKPEEEEMRPWYYTWSLMCRYFPKGTNILKAEYAKTDGLKMVAGESNGKLTIAMVNTGEKDIDISIIPPRPINNAKIYVYQKIIAPTNNEGFPVPFTTEIKIKEEPYSMMIKSESFILITENEY
ncbi:MAG: hypothetical protein AB7S48_09180 [Bacteroidales bacterium]